MIDRVKSKDVLFIDVETVPLFNTYSALPDNLKKHWEKKSERLCKEGETPGDIYDRAGIWAEFGRIICISVGFIYEQDGENIFRVRSFYHNNEQELLNEFKDLLLSFFKKRKNGRLCAHNGKEFDFPYIARRMIINGIGLPPVLDVAGAKPWEVPFLDTMELWKFGDHKHYTSLDLLTLVLGLPSPKNDINGEDVARVYYIENDLERIVRYCENDVLAVAQVFLRFKGEPVVNTRHQA